MTDPIYARKAWAVVRAQVLARDKGICQVCRAKADAVDHIVPWRQDGAWYDPENLRAICKRCNSARVSRAGNADRRPSREW